MKILNFLVKQVDILVLVLIVWFGNVLMLKLAATFLIVGLIIYIKLSIEQISEVARVMKMLAEDLKKNE